ncbi:MULTISPECIES: Card1-like endonuclease domain-containing protein [Microbulbifer]|nr:MULTISPECIES: DUF1887 family CARF protein [Microbulbifer]KUJ83440.1 hypothetical protein AVO43_06135 [Microbulbifer sp. ZGT114]
MSTVHICIVTGQPLANLLPILQLRPTAVVLLVSERMHDEVEPFQRLLQGLDWQPRVKAVNGLPDAGVAGIRAWGERVLLEELAEEFDNAEFLLNATGGNKLMVMALAEVFRELGEQLVYCDTTHGALEYLGPDSDTTALHADLLDIDSYLKANRITLRSSKSDDEDWQERAGRRKSFTKWLANKVDKLQPILGMLNKVCHQAGDSNGLLQQPRQQLQRIPRAEFVALLKQAAELGLIEWDDASPEQIEFCDQDALDYLHGGWLEEWAYWTARDAGARDVRLGCQFTDDGQRKRDVRNEMDVLVCHNNRLLLIECKTGNLRKYGSDSEVIYKLNSIAARTGGLFGEAWLLAAQHLDRERNGRSVSASGRALASNITPFDGERLKEFSAQLRVWLAAGTAINNRS